MATKAEQERSQQERSKPDLPKQAPAREQQASIRRENVRQQTAGRPAGGVTSSRNIREDHDDKATYELEDSGTGQPSRKSTRASANRIKPDSQLRRRETRRVSSPQARAAASNAAGTNAGGRSH